MVVALMGGGSIAYEQFLSLFQNLLQCCEIVLQKKRVMHEKLNDPKSRAGTTIKLVSGSWRHSYSLSRGSQRENCKGKDRQVSWNKISTFGPMQSFANVLYLAKEIVLTVHALLARQPARLWCHPGARWQGELAWPFWKAIWQCIPSTTNGIPGLGWYDHPGDGMLMASLSRRQN